MSWYYITNSAYIICTQEEFDQSKLFHKPVIDQHPEVEEAYLKKIETPMDFSTIRNERLSGYRVLSDLQNDLILVFKNCCTFNSVKSQFWNYAV